MIIRGTNRYTGRPFGADVTSVVESGCNVRTIGRGEHADPQAIAEMLGRLIDALAESGALSAQQIVDIVGSDELNEVEKPELVSCNAK